MFFPYTDPSVRFTGRFSPYLDSMATTACGSKIEIACMGDRIVLHFDMTGVTPPVSHLWIQADDESKYEVPVDFFIRVIFKKPGKHLVKIIYKSGVEIKNRWDAPLAGMHFQGYDADSDGTLPENNKKTIECFGDSITEGVLVDGALYNPFPGEHQPNRPYHDDFCETYANRTAEALGLEPLAAGYGAVGITKGGCGNVPKAIEMYDYCFSGAPVTYPSPDYIMINMGTNDMWAGEGFEDGYRELLSHITKKHPKAKIICLVPFYGCFRDEIKRIVSDFNEMNKTDIFLVDTEGWVPRDPLHPLIEGHKKIAERLIPILKDRYGL